jgi:hypothetical protein
MDKVSEAIARLQKYVSGEESGFRKSDIALILAELDRRIQRPTDDWA